MVADRASIPGEAPQKSGPEMKAGRLVCNLRRSLFN